MNWISWMSIGAVGIVASVFAVNNRETVELFLWPTPFVLELPLYLLLFGPFVTGIFFGWVWSWLASGKARARARRAEYAATVKQRDLDAAGQKLRAAETAREAAEEDAATARIDTENAAKALAAPEPERKAANG